MEGIKRQKVKWCQYGLHDGEGKIKIPWTYGFWGYTGSKGKNGKEGAADQETAWIVTHFSHNGGWTYERMTEDLKDTVFQAAFDGMCIEIGK